MIIGITGSIGSGKTHISEEFSSYGFHVVNVDKLYAALIKPGKEMYRALVKEFGQGIVRQNKSICRINLKKIVFSDSKKLTRLNNITHPLIKKSLVKVLRKSKAKNIVIDAPLLIESGFYKRCDHVVLIKINKKLQIKRALRRKKHSKEELLHIYNSQWSFSKKKPFADYIVDNNGRFSETQSQIKRIIKQLSLS